MADEQNWVRIGNDRLSAAINPFGAELSSLKDAEGRELMTNADPAFWTGHAPILFPVAMKLGIDPVHFGILIVVNMEVGMCHPPVGLNLYVASGITKMGITELTIATLPWLLTMLIFLVMVTYIPALSLWLPRMLGIL